MQKETNKTEYATKGDLEDLRHGLRKEINEDIRVHMGTLYEKFESEVKVVAESHLDTNREVKILGAKVDMLIETVGEMQLDMTEMKSDLSETKSNVAEIKDNLKNKTDLKDHKLLEKRVSVLETAA